MMHPVNEKSKGGLFVDNMQIGLKVVVELLRILRSFVKIISDFLPKHSGSKFSFADKASDEKDV